jgi:uncharacterized lipoprotein YmbA
VTRLQRLSLAIGLAAMMGLSGCRSITAPVSFYTLPPLDPGAVATAVDDNRPALTVGIQPVTLPGYLNRSEMVRRSGANRLEIASQQRWADYLDRMVQETLAENLQLLMPRDQVVKAPWPAGVKPEVTVDYQFQELIGASDGTMRMRVVWTLARRSGDPPAQSQRMSLTEPMPGSGFDALAAAHSRALAALGRRTAESLREFIKIPVERVDEP